MTAPLTGRALEIARTPYHPERLNGEQYPESRPGATLHQVAVMKFMAARAGIEEDWEETVEVALMGADLYCRALAEWEARHA